MRGIQRPGPSLRGLLFLLVAALTACASGPKIITNSAPGFSLANYQTFGFMQPLSTDRGEVRSIDSQQLIAATSRELVWEGAASGRVTGSVRENRQTVIGAAAREIFAQFA